MTKEKLKRSFYVGLGMVLSGLLTIINCGHPIFVNVEESNSIDDGNYYINFQIN